MVLHVDYDKVAWENNTPNNDRNHLRMTLIPADGQLSGANTGTDLWPQACDSLTNYSTPAATVYTGGYMNKPLTGMRVDAAEGIASFWYMKIRCDVNGDGEVNIADVNPVIDAILRGKFEEIYDVNVDGEVNIADVNAIIQWILKN